MNLQTSKMVYIEADDLTRFVTCDKDGYSQLGVFGGRAHNLKRPILVLWRGNEAEFVRCEYVRVLWNTPFAPPVHIEYESLNGHAEFSQHCSEIALNKTDGGRNVIEVWLEAQE